MATCFRWKDNPIRKLNSSINGPKNTTKNNMYKTPFSLNSLFSESRGYFNDVVSTLNKFRITIKDRTMPIRRYENIHFTLNTRRVYVSTSFDAFLSSGPYVRG